ncbi:MAG: TIGR00730 family Rossman fold protein, partial [Pseudomonadaceae bacterium]|nr:TIGR00730 family Rossman fold protein [Pseudomonadaceae bacterium]
RAEIGHSGLSRLEVVDGMHARKARMAELADAFVALPGGLGTLEELFEVWTWGQLGYHTKPIGLLEVDGFYARLTGFLDHLVAERFVREQHRAILQVDERPDQLLQRLAAWRPSAAPKWVDREPR